MSQEIIVDQNNDCHLIWINTIGVLASRAISALYNGEIKNIRQRKVVQSAS